MTTLNTDMGAHTKPNISSAARPTLQAILVRPDFGQHAYGPISRGAPPVGAPAGSRAGTPGRIGESRISVFRAAARARTARASVVSTRTRDARGAHDEHRSGG